MIRPALVVATLLPLLSGCWDVGFPLPEARVRRPQDGDCLKLERTEVAFGEIDVNTAAISRVSVKNRMSFEVALQVRVSGLPFSARQQLLRLAPGSSQLLDLEVAPSEGVAAEGTVTLVDPGVVGGCVVEIPLSVQGGNRLLFSESLDFGFVDPRQSTQRSLRFTNATTRELVVSDFVISGAQFSGQLPTVLRVPASSSVELPFTAGASVVGAFTGSVSFLAPGGRRTVGLYLLSARPTAQFGAQQIDFQQVAFSPAGPSFADRRLQLTNVGLSDASPNTQLRLVQPYFSIEPLGAASASELQLDVSAAILPLALNQTSTIGFHCEPGRLGSRQWRVTLFTNDPVQPSTVIDVFAEVVPQPACSATLSPATALELTTAGAMARGEFVLTNTGSGDCILDDVRLDESTAPGVFVLEAGEATQVVLRPQEAHRMVITAGSTGGVSSRGELRFHLMAQGEGVRRVPFIARVP